MHTNAHKWAKKRDIKMTCFLSIDNQYSKTHPFVDRKRQKPSGADCLWGACGWVAHVQAFTTRQIAKQRRDIVRMEPKPKFVVFQNPPTKNPINNRWGARKKKKKKKGAKKTWGREVVGGGDGENLCDNLFVWPVTNEFLCYKIFIGKGTSLPITTKLVRSY